MHIDEGLDILLKHKISRQHRSKCSFQQFYLWRQLAAREHSVGQILDEPVPGRDVGTHGGHAAAAPQQQQQQHGDTTTQQQRNTTLPTSHHHSGDTLPAAPFVQLSTRTVLAPTVTALSRPNWIIGFTLLLTNVNNLININSFPFPPQPLCTAISKIVLSVTSKIRSPSYY